MAASHPTASSLTPSPLPPSPPRPAVVPPCLRRAPGPSAAHPPQSQAPAVGVHAQPRH
jgi:hypothetical protein